MRPSSTTALRHEISRPLQLAFCPAAQQSARDVVLIDTAPPLRVFPLLASTPALTAGLREVVLSEGGAADACVVAFTLAAPPSVPWSLQGRNDGRRWTELAAPPALPCPPPPSVFSFLPCASHFQTYRVVSKDDSAVELDAGLQLWACASGCCRCGGVRVTLSGAPGCAALTLHSPDRSFVAAVCLGSEKEGLRPFVPRVGAWTRLALWQEPGNDGGLRARVDGEPATLRLRPGSRANCCLFEASSGTSILVHLGGLAPASAARPPLPPDAPAWEGLRARLMRLARPCPQSGLAFDAAAFPGSCLAPFKGAIELPLEASVATAPASATSLPLPRLRAAPLHSLEDVLAWEPGASAAAGLDDSLLRSRVPLRPRLPAGDATAIGASAVIGGPQRPLLLVCHDCGPAVYKEDSCAIGWKADSGAPLALGLIAPVEGEDALASVEVLPLLAGQSHEDDEEDAYPGSEACAAVPAPPSVPAALLPPHQPSLSSIGRAYTFPVWHATDVFVYFSHARVSIPPPSWIEVGHTHGTRVLGSIVTEWADGRAANAALLAQPEAFAAKLASLAGYYGFDGWLVNVEADVSSSGGSEGGSKGGWTPEALALVSFLRALTAAVKAAVPTGGLVIAYDAIDGRSGRVAWQSALVPHANGPFLEACDGLFLDYHWDTTKLAATAAAASASGRPADVFVGLDVWGRGMPGGGRWATRDAAASVRACHPLLSLAVFGPAWTYEAAGGRSNPVLQAALDLRLWGGEGEVGPEDGVPASALPHVCNPNGSGPCAVRACANKHGLMRLANVGTSTVAEEGPLAGWEVLASGGGGWGVTALEPADAPTPAAPPPSCFVASHAWCGARTFISLRSAQAALPGASVTVREWVAGTGPNTADPFRVRAWLVRKGSVGGGEGGEGRRYVPLRCEQHAADERRDGSVSDPDADPTSPPCPACAAVVCDTGLVTAGASWRPVSFTFPRLPAAAVGLVLEHWGRDAEHWGGHYGTRFTGAEVRLQRPPTAAVGLLGAAALDTDPVRPCALALSTSASPSLSTTFCTGYGRALFSRGAVSDPRPWVNLRSTALAPSFLGHAAVGAGLGGLEGVLRQAVGTPAMAGALGVLAGGGGGGGISPAHDATTLELPWDAEALAAAVAAAARSGSFASLSTQVVQDWAWEGGSSLLLAPAPAAEAVVPPSEPPPPPPPAHVTLAAGRVLSLHLPPTTSSIQVQLITKAPDLAAYPGCKAVLVLPALLVSATGAVVLPRQATLQATELPQCTRLSCELPVAFGSSEDSSSSALRAQLLLLLVNVSTVPHAPLAPALVGSLALTALPPPST